MGMTSRSRRYLAMSRNIFGYHKWWWCMCAFYSGSYSHQMASNGWRAEKQLNILEAHGSLPQQRMIPPKMPMLLLLRKPNLKDIMLPSISVTQEVISTSSSSVCTLYQCNCWGNRAGDVDVWNLSNLHTVCNLSNESKSTHHFLN